jgi:hyperosmotically inducible periplasmic protein
VDSCQLDEKVALYGTVYPYTADNIRRIPPTPPRLLASYHARVITGRHCPSNYIPSFNPTIIVIFLTPAAQLLCARGNNVRSFRSTFLKFPLYGCMGLTCVNLLPITSFAQDQTSPPATATQDNSAKNKVHSHTADQQSEATSDRMLTKKIRQSLIADKSLSTYGHNIKIITKDGMVTLKGPVHSEDEKSAIASKAAEVAGGQDKITNQLTVKQ